jgi:hypothetical protein
MLYIHDGKQPPHRSYESHCSKRGGVRRCDNRPKLLDRLRRGADGGERAHRTESGAVLSLLGCAYEYCPKRTRNSLPYGNCSTTRQHR